MIDARLFLKCLIRRQKVESCRERDKCYSCGLTSQGHRAWAFQLRTFQRTKFWPTGAKWLFNETVIPDWALDEEEEGQKPSLEHDGRGVVFTYIRCDPINHAGIAGNVGICAEASVQWKRCAFSSSSFQLQFVHADEAKMQSVKENVKMKDRWKWNSAFSNALGLFSSSTRSGCHGLTRVKHTDWQITLCLT